MRRFLVYIALLAALFLAQTAAFRVFLPLTDIVPNLLLILAVSFGLMRGDRTGLLIGFSAGLMLDIVYGDRLGLYALMLMFIGFIAGKFRHSFSADRFFLALVLIGASDLVYGFMCYALLFLLRARFHFRFYLLHVLLPEAAWTLTISLFLYPLLYLIDGALEVQEIRRAKKFV